MDIKIRRVKPEDLDAVCEVECAGFSPEERASKEMLRERIEKLSDSFFVAETRGEDGEPKMIIGLVNGCLSNRTAISDEMYTDTSYNEPDGQFQLLFGLAVHPDYRRKGISEQLVHYVLDHARETGLRGAALACKINMIHYFEKFGFRNEGMSRSTYVGETWYDMQYRF